MSNTPSIEDASSPAEFIAALRAQAEKCRESCAELSAAWQDEQAGKFWIHAAQRLERIADQLDEVKP